MKYIATAFFFLFGNEILSLLALCVITVLFGWDLMKARLQ